MRRAATFAFFVFLSACASTRPSAPPIFEFHDNFWMNLHHFLRAAGRGMPVVAPMEPAERKAWDDAVALYASSYSKRDLLFDDGMVAIKNELRRFEGKDSLEGAAIDPPLRSALERAAPVYRRYFWPAQRAANEAWIAAVKPLVRAHGQALSKSIAAAYGVAWPSEPIPVDLSVAAGANNAYTSSLPTHTTLSPDPSYQGLAALELVFHEASHAWGTMLQGPIARAAEAQKKTLPRQLWHAVLFYNAGELTRRTLENDGVPGYVDLAKKHDIYRDLCGDGCRDRVAAAWDRHLDGSATLDAALEALVTSWPAN